MTSIVILEDGSVILNTVPVQAPTPPSLDSVCGRAEAAAQEAATSKSTPIKGD